MATTKPPRSRFRYPGWITGGVVALATAVMAVVAVLEYLEPDADATADQGTAPATSDGPGSPSHPAPAGGADPSGDSGGPVAVNLANLTLISGVAALAPLPEELEDERGYEGAVVIGCPSNQTGDRFREVIYETRYLYATLDAQLRPYRNPTDNVLVNLRVYSDPPDRQPGAALPGEPHLEQLRMGETRDVRGIAIGDAYRLRLRVECEKPSGYMILVGAVLQPAT